MLISREPFFIFLFRNVYGYDAHLIFLKFKAPFRGIIVVFAVMHRRFHPLKNQPFCVLRTPFCNVITNIKFY